MPKRRQPTAFDEGSHWHLDRKVPIALILSLCAQTAGLVYWGATVNARISVLEQKADVAAPQGDRLTRVEERLATVQDGILEIKSILRKEPLLPKAR